MKIHLIKKQTIEDFVTANARSRSSFAEWLKKLKHADWATPMDIKATF
jgi:mRNA interferase HigB